MLLLKIFTLIILLSIFLQDVKSRSVYWLLFPSLTLCLLLIRFRQPFVLPEIVQAILINVGFLLMQLFILTVYFSIRSKKWVNMTNQLLGVGDLLFLLSTAFYLSVLNYLFFYITSLLCTLLIWILWQLFFTPKNKYIPLAGFQSLIFIVFLASDWWFRLFDLTNDAWLLNLMNR